MSSRFVPHPEISWFLIFINGLSKQPRCLCCKKAAFFRGAMRKIDAEMKAGRGRVRRGYHGSVGTQMPGFRQRKA
jgi:hypothetical protein